VFQLIQFTKEFDAAVAKQEDEEFQFMPLGDVVETVVMRLSTDLPRIRCEALYYREEGAGEGLAG